MSRVLASSTVDSVCVLEPSNGFDFILGKWALSRTIFESETGVKMATISGSLDIRRLSEHEALYSERVRVQTAAGAGFFAAQSYHVCRSATGFALLLPASQSLFQQLCFRVAAAGVLAANGTHACGDDLYVSEYWLGPGRQLAIQHAVRGPRKQYVALTTCVVRDAELALSSSAERTAGRST